MKKYFLLILFLCFHLHMFSQDMINNSVVVHEDARIALIVHKPTVKVPFTGKMRGYRIQIYNGNDRNEANKIKIAFLRQFPQTRAYLTFHNPQFRVRVGDFKSRKEASEFTKKLSGHSGIMIVPEIIQVTAK